jgi:hypothetical protein
MTPIQPRAAIPPAPLRPRVMSASGPRAAAYDDTGRSPSMTSRTSNGGSVAGRLRLAGRLRAAAGHLSDRVHADGDERAHAMGWTVTPTAGRFGLSARTYRDPRFGPPSPALPAGIDAESQPATTARERR